MLSQYFDSYPDIVTGNIYQTLYKIINDTVVQ